jgi:hypothetical protein
VTTGQGQSSPHLHSRNCRPIKKSPAQRRGFFVATLNALGRFIEQLIGREPDNVVSLRQPA